MKHLTVRFAWHDNKWNGRICRSPSGNVYCVDNYSLLSSRIQRRRNIEIEEKAKGRTLSEVSEEYLPPCYWCINLLGDKEYGVKDRHPFCDTWDKFSNVPPIAEILKPFSVFTWNFKLSFTTTGAYRYPPDLKDRVKRYIKKIKPSKSIVFFYANYSNPITADERKYLILGAGVVKDDIKLPKEYEFSQELYHFANEKMPVFPKMAWQFQISLDPELTFILPYHEYLQYIDKKDNIKREEKEQWLEEITVKVEDSTIIPHFKYVSMHLPHDKAIFLLYKIKKSITNAKKHGILPIEVLENYEKRVDKLLEIAWKARGQYPGFENLLATILKGSFPDERIEDIVEKLKNNILENFESVDEFLSDVGNLRNFESDDSELNVAVKIIVSHSETFLFLARFDFSKHQFKNVLDFVGRKGIENFKSSPYSLLEEYYYDIKDDDWDIDNNEYGVSLYHIDIALIPDTRFAKWDILYTAKSLERIRALVTLILREAAQNEGHTYLSREEIVQRIRNYPLYYIQDAFEIDQTLLINFENDARFKEQFSVLTFDDQVVYQLKSLWRIERELENFILSVSKREYKVDHKQINLLINKDLEMFKEKFYDDISWNRFAKERRELYKKILKNKLVVVTGKAGSGKTSAVINLVPLFKDQRKVPIFIFTPTGKASLVIRKRLKELNLDGETNIRISTMHRFIFRELFERARGLSRQRVQDIWKLTEYAEKILDGRYEYIAEFSRIAKGLQFHPKVVIVDEASMVDETLLCLVLSLINPSTLQHLIIIGDDKQLPPIGIGRPFIDLIYYLKNQGFEEKLCSLRTNLRFPVSKDKITKIEEIAELFRNETEPLVEDVEDIIESQDETLEISYFKDIEDLVEKLRQILKDITKEEIDTNLWKMFCDVFEPDGEFDYDNLEKIQIITPKRVGKFGSIAINREIVLGGQTSISNGIKIICEENQYLELEKNKRVLALANGSIGYLTRDGKVKFVDMDDLLNMFPKERKKIISKLVKIKRELLNQVEKTDIPYTPAYGITVHKSQGSDFEYVIFILSEGSSFITRELLYTGLTRAKKKMYILIQEELRDEIYDVFRTAHINSQIELINTLLFGHKYSPLKPYIVQLNDGRKIAVRSKIEYIIAKTLDGFGIEFIYEPEDFKDMKPDFKIFFDDQIYYWEHLGLLHSESYKNRWFKKFKKYESMGIVDFLITTSEAEEPSDIETRIKEIIDDLKNEKLKVTESSYSRHHYVI